MNRSCIESCCGVLERVLIIAVLAVFSGCSGGGLPGLYPVKGTVTHNGSPVDGATVSFISKGDGRPATAVTKADGSYELYTLDSAGAMPGTYSVVVTKLEAPPEASDKDAGFDASGQDQSMVQAAASANKAAPKAKLLLPAKYSSAETTPLDVEVKNASNVIDLKIE